MNRLGSGFYVILKILTWFKTGEDCGQFAVDADVVDAADFVGERGREHGVFLYAYR